jgi:hypothetical protein
MLWYKFDLAGEPPSIVEIERARKARRLVSLAVNVIVFSSIVALTLLGLPEAYHLIFAHLGEPPSPFAGWQGLAKLLTVVTTCVAWALSVGILLVVSVDFNAAYVALTEAATADGWWLHDDSQHTDITREYQKKVVRMGRKLLAGEVKAMSQAAADMRRRERTEKKLAQKERSYRAMHEYQTSDRQELKSVIDAKLAAGPLTLYTNEWAENGGTACVGADLEQGRGGYYRLSLRSHTPDRGDIIHVVVGANDLPCIVGLNYLILDPLRKNKKENNHDL